MEDQEKEKRGRRGEGTIYWDKARGCYRGDISLGKNADGTRNRPTVYGRTIEDVQEKFRELRAEAKRGVKTTAKYTVADCVRDWLGRGLKGRRERTVELYTWFANKHVIPALGSKPLRNLEADHIEDALDDRTDVFSDRSMKMFVSILHRSIKLAIRRKKVTSNVAEDIELPEGKEGRPSKAMTVEVARWSLARSRGWLHAYLAVTLTTGMRTEEARPAQWSSLHLDAKDDVPPHAEVWRSVRKHGETKNEWSKRTVALSPYAVKALKAWRVEQERHRRRRAERLGIPYAPARHAFGTRDDEVKDAKNVRRALRNLFSNAKKKKELPKGWGVDWTPRETRTTFVSIMSDEDQPVERIAKLVGHSRTSTTESVYRKQIRPVITTGTEVVGALFEEG